MSDIDTSREAVERLALQCESWEANVGRKTRKLIPELLRALLTRAEAAERSLSGWIEAAVKEKKRVDTAKRSLAALRAQMAWQPIETAPRDGPFEAYEAGVTYKCGWVMDDDGEGTIFSGWWDYTSKSFENPTHWRPLPNAPEAP